MSKLEGIKRSLWETIFPPNGKCVFCKRLLLFELSPFCFSCEENIHWIKGPGCEKCGKEELLEGFSLCSDCSFNDNHYDRGVALFTYTKEASKIIGEIKYQGNKDLGKNLGVRLGRKIKKMDLKSIDMIFPIPLHPNRQKQRGFNQSGEIAKGISKEISIPIVENLLIRVKDTPHQTGLAKVERQRNIKNAFKLVSEKAVLNKTILLVDDVYTTGSTMDECSQILKNAGAGKIYFGVLATGRW